jgi:uncharacterized SAM-binding protein YcdF (DUF218 family)
MLLVFLTLSFIGFILQWRGRRPFLLVIGIVGMLLWSWPPFDWLLSRPFDARYPARTLPPTPVGAIVVLSSTVRPPAATRPYPLPDIETFERCEYAAWLYRHWQAVPVLTCGGSHDSRQYISATMRELLQRAGVPSSMIWTEEYSESTHENAVYGAKILHEHKVGTIALVVETQSMWRAEACFRKSGIDVVPTPCRYRKFGHPAEELMPNWKAIYRNEITLHETLGMGWYWLHGWV